MFTPITHPELRKLGRKHLHNFIRERERYLLRLEDIKASGASVQPVSLKTSIDPDLLLSLVEFGEFNDTEKLEDLTEGKIQSWLDEKSNVSLDSMTVEDLNAAVKTSVRINVHESDPEMRIKALFMDYKTFLRIKKWDSLLEKNPKLAVEHICSLLKPPALKTKIEADLSLGQHKLRKQFMAFYKYVLEQAIYCDKFVSIGSTAEQKSSAKTLKPSGCSSNCGHDPQRNRHGNETLKPTSQPSGKPSKSTTQTLKPATAISSAVVKDLPNCLNPKCKDKHLIKDCPITGPEQRKALLKDFYEARKATAEIKVLHSSIPSNGRGRFKAKLADKVEVVVNGDTGADHSAISERHLESLAAESVFVQVLPLSVPVTVRLALASRPGENEIIYTSKKKARISTTLDLPVGPMRLRNVEYLVFEEEMSEVLLSRPLLKSLGFDLDAHLAVIRDTFHDSDFSHIGFQDSQPATELPIIPSDVSHRLLNRNGTSLSLVGRASTGGTEPTTIPSPLFYGDGVDDDPFRWDDGPDTGDEDPFHTAQVLQTRYEEAIQNGLPSELHSELKDMLVEFADIFRTQMGSDPPADVEPMEIRLKPDSSPVRVKLRRYSPPQMAFLRKKTDELLRLGLIKRNNRSQWACAPLLVPKEGPEQFRFTVDLRPVNRQTIPFAWPMPNLESATTQLSEDTCFALIDLCHCYWQFPVEYTSQECQSFITPDGVFTPTRVLHGQSNATAYVQSTVQSLCTSIRDEILQWLDDILFHCRTARNLLTALREFFKICRTHGLKLHASKCQFFLKIVSWCGRIISEDGVRLDPSRLDALINMPKPSTGDQLLQFLCAANWMRTVIPNFNALVEPLHEVLEEVFENCLRRTKQCAAKISMSETRWNEAHDSVFEEVKIALKESVTLAHPDPRKALCLFTDASDTHWGGVLTQVPHPDLDIRFENQRHEPLSFISGSFKGSSSRWSTAEKEAFAIVECISRLDYIVLRPEGFFLFTDHKNLVFIFDPVSVNARIQKHVANKIERWALLLSSFRYTIVHITGEDNCWADLLSRWGATPIHTHTLTVSALLSVPVAPDLDPDFTWPSSHGIRQSQQAAFEKGENIPANVVKNSSIWTNPNGAIWIPSSDTKLIMRILIIGHCGRAGHRGHETTLRNISDYCVWNGMNADVLSFCNTCLHCVATSGSRRSPRPLAHALHSDKPNELLHFDFLFMGKSDSGPSYVLIIKDDASSYTWLESCQSADAESTVLALLRWFAAFGVALNWCSDRGSHFKNHVMNALNRALHAHHHFTTAYCPQSNGTVETVCKEVLRACRALLSEFRLREREWPAVIMLVQSILNHSKRPSLGNIAPITAFTGQEPDNPLRTFLPPGSSKPCTLDFVKAQRLIRVEQLRIAIDKIHKEVSARRTRRRNDAVKRHNERTHVKPVNFEIGDFVMVAKRDKKDGHKLRVVWSGPRRVTRAISELVYECEDLITGAHHNIHANRLKIYADSSLNVTEDMLDTVEHNDPHMNTVEELLGLQFNVEKEIYEVRIKWRGFDDEDPTWEPFPVMLEDIPDKLESFLKTYPDQNMVRDARNSVVA